MNGFGLDPGLLLHIYESSVPCGKCLRSYSPIVCISKQTVAKSIQTSTGELSFTFLSIVLLHAV